MFSRTFHPDEANQAFTVGRLLETGHYTYRPTDHHGPTLYYAAAPLQRAFGHTTTADLDGTLLRCTPLLFAVLGLALLAHAVFRLSRSWLGALMTVLLVGTAPLFAFFATDFIQEMLLVCFTLTMLWAGVGYERALHPDAAAPRRLKPGSWALLLGIGADLPSRPRRQAFSPSPPPDSRSADCGRSAPSACAPRPPRARRASTSSSPRSASSSPPSSSSRRSARIGTASTTPLSPHRSTTSDAPSATPPLRRAPTGTSTRGGSISSGFSAETPPFLVPAAASRLISPSRTSSPSRSSSSRSCPSRCSPSAGGTCANASTVRFCGPSSAPPSTRPCCFRSIRSSPTRRPGVRSSCSCRSS